MLQEAIIILTVVIIAVWYFSYYRFYWYMKDFMEIKYIPIFGGLAALRPDEYIDDLTKFTSKYGRSFWGMLFIYPILITSDPKLVEVIVSSPNSLKKSVLYKMFHNFFGEGLITSSGEKWKTQRKLINPTFHFNVLERYVDNFNSTTDHLITEMSKVIGQNSTDIDPLIASYISSTICESAMGSSFTEISILEAMFKGINIMTTIFINRLFNLFHFFDFTYRFTKSYTMENYYSKLLSYIVSSIIRDKQSRMNDNNRIESTDAFGIKRKEAFLETLLLCMHENGEVNETQLRDEVNTFFIAGNHTTAATINFVLYALATFPEVQDRTLKEVKEILSTVEDGHLTLKNLQKMKYLESVIQETMRMFSTVPIIARQLTEDINFDGKVLPKNLTVIVAISEMHKNPDYFPDPDKFIPERFLKANSNNKHPFSYIPFSAGPRNCIGHKFAMLLIKITIAKLLMKYEFLSVGHKLNLCADLVLKSKNGVMLKIVNRK